MGFYVIWPTSSPTYIHIYICTNIKLHCMAKSNIQLSFPVSASPLCLSFFLSVLPSLQQLRGMLSGSRPFVPKVLEDSVSNDLGPGFIPPNSGYHYNRSRFLRVISWIGGVRVRSSNPILLSLLLHSWKSPTG